MRSFLSKCLRQPVVALLTVQVVFVGLCGAMTLAFAQTAFYRAAPDEIIGEPGTLIRQERMPISPESADAYRILYRSIGLQGEPIAVSGVVIIPKGSVWPQGRRIVAWAHPTSGIVPRCAPSLAFFLYHQVPGLRAIIEQGYIIAATDYPGLGTTGPHPYLVGTSEGRAVIDSVRAARQLAGNTTTQFAVWGHSQGGQAVLYAGLLAKSYAPELELVGVAAAAPATDLATLLRDDINTVGGSNLLFMTLWSWSRVFDASLDGIVDRRALPVMDDLANHCLESILDIFPRRRIGQALLRHFLLVDDLTHREPWRTLLAENTAGELPPSVPVFLAQGETDDVVPPAVTLDYMKRLCAAGSAVRLLMLPSVGHAFVARDSAAAAIEWIGDRFERKNARNDCVHK